MARTCVILCLLGLLVFAPRGRAQTPGETQAALEKIVARQPHDLAARVALANFLSDQGDPAQALGAWLAAQKIAPEDPAIAQAIGESELGLGNITAALAAYRQASQLQPQNALHHYSLANVLFVFRHRVPMPEPEAIRLALLHFSEAVRLDPLNEDYVRSYGETFYAVPQPDWRAAAAAWTHLAEISPKKDFAWSNLARVSLRAGDRAAAREWLAKITDPAFQGLRQKLEQQAMRATTPSPGS